MFGEILLETKQRFKKAGNHSDRNEY